MRHIFQAHSGSVGKRLDGGIHLWLVVRVEILGGWVTSRMSAAPSFRHGWGSALPAEPAEKAVGVRL